VHGRALACYGEDPGLTHSIEKEKKASNIVTSLAQYCLWEGAVCQYLKTAGSKINSRTQQRREIKGGRIKGADIPADLKQEVEPWTPLGCLFLVSPLIYTRAPGLLHQVLGRVEMARPEQQREPGKRALSTWGGKTGLCDIWVSGHRNRGGKCGGCTRDSGPGPHPGLLQTFCLSLAWVC
jgi:hypothetical protein